MIFDIDKQTIKDLELFPERGIDKSIFSFYDRTTTYGGQLLLLKQFNNPVSNLETLQNRQKEIHFFFENNCGIILIPRQIDFIELYLKNRRTPLKDNIIDAAYDRLSNTFSTDNDYYVISEGILFLVKLLVQLEKFIDELKSISVPVALVEDIEIIKIITDSKVIKGLLSNPPKQTKDLNFHQINKLDYFFRVKSKNQLRDLLNIVYKIDVLQTLSQLMKTDGFTLPEFDAAADPSFEVIDAFHPFITDAVENSFAFNRDSNLCFITGPNMSGKSTFLKTMGLLIYLSHLGFPVPAKKLRTTIFDGLFTTINLTDNINLGYSHFYSEVKRVKDITLKISTSKNIVVIFDELFRGTNVKDAYDASLVIITALAKIRNNFFFISTHILEVAEDLDKNDLIMFRCFESELVDQQPVSDFKIKVGISKERIGMQIIKNEKIIEILDRIVEKQIKREVQA